MLLTAQPRRLHARLAMGEVIKLRRHVGPVTPPRVEIRERIQAAVAASGLTDDAFAAELGRQTGYLHLHGGFVRCWESGEAMPPADLYVTALRLGTR